MSRELAKAAMAATFVLALAGGGAQAQEKIPIGAILPMTGPASDIGDQEKQALVFEADLINEKGGIRGHKIELLVEDNQAKPETAVVAFNKLTDLEKVQVMVVGFSGPTLAMAPLATRKKILMINGGAQGDKLNDASPYLFNAMPLLNDELAALAKFVYQDLGKKNAAILYQNDATGTPGRDDFQDSFTKLGGKIVASEAVPFGETNFRAALAKIQDAKPDVMFAIMTQNYPQLGEQVAQQKLPFPVVANTNLNTPDAVGSPSTAGFYFTAFKLDAPDDLNAEYKKRYGRDMTFYGRQFYNALSLVVKSLDKALADGKAPTGENARAALLEIKTFQGLSGPITFTTNTAQMDITINQVKDGKGVFVKAIK